MPDPIVTGGILALAGTAVSKIEWKPIEEFITALAGHPGESLPTLLGNIGRRRLTNAEAVAEKAHFILLDIGVTAKPLTDNVLHPILEGASLQEDEYFQTRWAYLLANAADSRNKHPFEICFAGMLRNLSGREVKFLDGLFNDMRPYNVNERRLHMIYREAGLARMPLPSHMEHYSTKVILNSEDEAEFDLMMDILKRETILTDNAEGKSGPNRFTRLGFAFVQACQKPEGFSGVLADA